MVLEIVAIFSLVIVLFKIMYQLFASDSWLQQKRFDRMVNLIQLEGIHGPINVVINKILFEVSVKHGIVENCHINICGPYSNTIVYINGKPMCMIHRISDISSIFMRRSVEYNDDYRINEIDNIINAAYKVAKKRLNERYNCFRETRTKSLYKEKGE